LRLSRARKFFGRLFVATNFSAKDQDAIDRADVDISLVISHEELADLVRVNGRSDSSGRSFAREKHTDNPSRRNSSELSSEFLSREKYSDPHPQEPNKVNEHPQRMSHSYVAKFIARSSDPRNTRFVEPRIEIHNVLLDNDDDVISLLRRINYANAIRTAAVNALSR